MSWEEKYSFDTVFATKGARELLQILFGVTTQGGSSRICLFFWSDAHTDLMRGRLFLWLWTWIYCNGQKWPQVEMTIFGQKWPLVQKLESFSKNRRKNDQTWAMVGNWGISAFPKSTVERSRKKGWPKIDRSLLVIYRSKYTVVAYRLFLWENREVTFYRQIIRFTWNSNFQYDSARFTTADRGWSLFTAGVDCCTRWTTVRILVIKWLDFLRIYII